MTHDILMLIIIFLVCFSFYFFCQWLECKCEIKSLTSQLKARPDIDMDAEIITVVHHGFGRTQKQVYKLMHPKKEEEQS